MYIAYWINDSFIDTTRNLILTEAGEISLPKKAIAVLTLLAENAGRVVSHDTLMQEIWPNTIVAPNTLQRCIAQLHKAFGDNSKKQTLIKTHAKQGYSLDAHVRWQTDIKVQTNVETPNRITDYKSVYYKGIAIMLAVGIFLLLSVLTPPTEIKVTKVVPLTATDARESSAQYSLDGHYLVFHRFQNSVEHHLWAKDLSTKQENQLTKNPGNYGSHSWSSDGSQLAFMQRIESESTGDICWRIATLDFAAALRQPQPVTARSTCLSERTAIARWLSNGDIGVLQNVNANNHVLRTFDVITRTFTTLYTPDTGKCL